MIFHRYISAILVSLVVTGCANVQTLAKVDPAPADLTVLDHRTPQAKEALRISNFSAVKRLADDQFEPRALDMFRNALQNNKRVARPTVLEIDDFAVVDFFPKRLGLIGTGFLGHLLVSSLIEHSTNWDAVADANPPKDQDSLVCLVSGKINGVPFRFSASETYHLSLFATLIYKDEDYQRALKIVIDRVADGVADQVSHLADSH